MATETPAAPAAPETPIKVKRAKREGPSRSFGRTLTDGRNQLKFLANVTKNGTWTSYVVHREQDTNGKLVKSSRGGTNSHADMAAAQAEIDKAVRSAVKAGWEEKKGGGGGGFHARPDSFSLSNLPKPTKQ